MSNIVCDEGQAWIVHVEPSRDLTVGDKEDLSNPRRMLHERPDRVAQLLNKNSKKHLILIGSRHVIQRRRAFFTSLSWNLFDPMCSPALYYKWIVKVVNFKYERINME